MRGKDQAYWLADKIPAYGDYAKEAANVLRRQADDIERLHKENEKLRRVVFCGTFTTDKETEMGIGMNEWRNEPAPTHRCEVCGGLWRFWRKSETPCATCDTWNMRSQCFDCCADAPMRDQIKPLTLGQMEQYLRARLAVDAMVQHAEGPKAGDPVQ